MKQAEKYDLVTEMIYWLVENQASQPSLQSLSERFGLSPHHLQRTFLDFTGVSPKQFLRHLTREKALERLKAGRTVLDASFDCGLSGPGRLHDLLVSTEALTPGQARNAGQGVHIEYGFGSSPFGDCLLAWTDRGLCFLGFCHSRTREEAVSELTGQWRDARYSQHTAAAERHAETIFSRARPGSLKIWLRGTPFQLRVWQALLAIPPGMHCSYGQIARALGQPGAARAVGTAIGDNPVSLLIPCHRVITHSAGLGGYRWGIETKQALIACEAGSNNRRQVSPLPCQV
jgi:AraC family transcriptional regulator of adaptative response/methylated-DNA-[protein]-cysteine methyltransferase